MSPMTLACVLFVALAALVVIIDRLIHRARKAEPVALPAATQDIRQRLGVQLLSQLSSVSRSFDSFLVPDYLTALQVILRADGLEIETRDIVSQNRLFTSSEEDLWNYLIEGLPGISTTPPQLATYRVGVKEERLLPDRALHIVGHAEHPAVFFLVHPSIGSEKKFRLCGYTRDHQAAGAWLAKTMERIADWVRENNCCRRAQIRPTFHPYHETTDVEFMTMGDSAEIHLNAEVIEQLRENFLVFKENEQALQGMGVETQRGLLFCGPPGNGKTSTLRFLRRSLPDHTFLVPSLSSLGSTPQLFALAKFLAPSVVVLEDVDLYLMSRDQNPFVNVLGQLMNEMDGLQPRHRVDVIMSSNSWKAIEQALARRPGRIDHVIQFDNPADEQRRSLLTMFLREVPHTAPLSTLVSLTEGMAVAQLKEVVKKSVAHALAARTGADPLQVSMGDFQHAARVIRDNPFQPHTTRPRSMRRDPDALRAIRPVQVPPVDGEDPTDPGPGADGSGS